MKNSLLNINVSDGVLNIRIGVNALKKSIESGRLDMSINGSFVIDDIEAFTTDFADELRSQEEDGSTLVDLMFDQAALSCLENGGSGCDIAQET